MIRLMTAMIMLTVLLYSCRGGKKDPAAAEQERLAAIQAADKQYIDSLKLKLQDGDLVLRSGIGWESDQIRDFQVKDKHFTHVGMARNMNGQWMVCHVTGRDSIFYKDDLTHYELVDSFISHRRCSAFGLYRTNMSAAEKTKALAYMDSCEKKKVKFDIFFDMKNDTAMTCSEMVSKAITAGTGGRITFSFTPVTERRHIILIKRFYKRYKPKDSEIIGRPIISVDDITTNAACREIQRYAYQQ